jgi:hypothetical protein
LKSSEHLSEYFDSKVFVLTGEHHSPVREVVFTEELKYDFSKAVKV